MNRSTGTSCIDEDSRVRLIPWDTTALGIDCYEIVDPDPRILRTVTTRPGHYTARVDPLADKRDLHDAGFYYCDSLIEPWCKSEMLLSRWHRDAAFTAEVELDPLLAICRNAFLHGRFHRDFNIDPARADRRFEAWLVNLHGEGRVLGLIFKSEVVGFIAPLDGSLALHAMGEAHRGKGIAKYLWTAVCQHLFKAGYPEIRSSISYTNIAVIGLYTSLGFRFRKPVDIYHKLVT